MNPIRASFDPRRPYAAVIDVLEPGWTRSRRSRVPAPVSAGRVDLARMRHARLEGKVFPRGEHCLDGLQSLLLSTPRTRAALPVAMRKAKSSASMSLPRSRLRRRLDALDRHRARLAEPSA
ncbi:MAG: hypothetical protein PGN25_08805 [Methylorubrum populi]